MRVIEPGHIYELDVLDSGAPEVLRFVNRESGTEHPGTQTQEVLRAQIDVLDTLIDRTNHCDGCLPWAGNERIIKAMTEAQRQLRLALLIHEQRAMERKLDRDGWQPETAHLAEDGHFAVGGYSRRALEEQMAARQQWLDGLEAGGFISDPEEAAGSSSNCNDDPIE